MHFMAAHQRAEYLQAERAVSMASYSEYSAGSGRNQVTHRAQFMHCTLHSHPTKNRKSPEQSSEVRSESPGIWLWSSLQTRLKSHHTPVTHLWLRCMKQNRVKEFHCSLYLLLKDNRKNPLHTQNLAHTLYCNLTNISFVEHHVSKEKAEIY